MRRFALLLSCGVLSSALVHAGTDPEKIAFFEDRIRPVLVEHCYECHNTADTAEAGLALDFRGGLLQGSDSGPVLAGAESKLLQVIRHEIDGMEMPEGGPKLDKRVIADFEKWILWGAPDPRKSPPSTEDLAQVTSWNAIREKRMQWWSFQPIRNPPPPEIEPAEEFASWKKNDVDRFIYAALQEELIQPVQRAEKAVLIQRLCNALIGLPPTPVQIRDFLADRSEDAYERLVEELLESPHFGERWARHWMDWVRYAESHGSEGDPRIEGAELYRDYLIRALNNDVGYDQLLTEHIAGDLLEHPRINSELNLNESLIGTAHWRMVFHGFAPTDVLEEKVRFTDDAIDTFSKAFLGLTVSCARCHDHKFDAISQADYYALFGILGSTRPGRASATIDEQSETRSERLKTLKSAIRESLVSEWTEYLASTELGLPPFLDEFNDGPVGELWRSMVNDYQRYAEARELIDESEDSWDLTSDVDYSEWLKHGEGLPETVGRAGELVIAVDGDRLIQDVLPSGVYSHLVSSKLGARLASKDFYLDRDYKVWLEICGGGKSMSRYVVQNYPRNGTVFPVSELNSARADWRWQSYDLKYWQGDDVHLEMTTANDAPLLVKNRDRSWFGIRSAVLLPSDAPGPPAKRIDYLKPLIDAGENATPDSLSELNKLVSQSLNVAVEAWAKGKLDDGQAEWIDMCLHNGVLPNAREGLVETAGLVDQYRELESQIPVAKRVPTITEWRGSDQALYDRGNHKKPLDLVPRRFLEAIDATPYDALNSGRDQLAEDMLREDNPFTARVIVNRVWTHLFGRGIVATPDNFGRLGAEPTHPELLDFLANEFRTDANWSLKSLIRKVVLSETWRQSSSFSVPAGSEHPDPDNRLYSRGSLRRLDAESIRDKLLSVSGTLDPQFYGAPSGGEGNRRSVYVRIKRNALDPFLTSFDAPVPFSTTGLRSSTNVPAQSLMMLNSPFVERLSRSFVDVSVRKDQEELSVRNMWVRAFGRQPDRKELGSAVSYLENMRMQYEQLRKVRLVIASQIGALQRQISGILESARATLRKPEVREPEVDLRPIATWDFAQRVEDVGMEQLELQGSAKLTGEALVLDGNGWALAALEQDLVGARTFEVRVQLDSLEQRGGGVMTVQSKNGSVFDSIVFGEKQPKQWLAGSNGFARTKEFRKAPEESVLDDVIHVAITYESDGTVTCYREGQVYGRPYTTQLQSYSSGDSAVVFGLRHGVKTTAGRMLTGKLFSASLYDRALTAEEVMVAAEQTTQVTRSSLLASLDPGQRRRLKDLESAEQALNNRLAEIEVVNENQHWIDLAHAIFNMKEFIYVR